MEIIKSLVEKIDEELEDAEKYIDCAYKEREEHPELSSVFFRLSKEEMAHSAALHDQVVRIIESIKQQREIPPEMKYLYDYLHERQIKWSQEIEFKQKNYK